MITAVRRAFAGEPTSVLRARGFVQGVLGGAFVGEPVERTAELAAVIADATLAVSELATNAVRHTRSGRGGRYWVTVKVTRGGVLVSVTDQGADCAPLVPQAADESGRGLAIVSALGSVAVCPTATGRRVTVLLPFSFQVGEGVSAE